MWSSEHNPSISSAACPVELTWPKKLIGASINRVTSARPGTPGRHSRSRRRQRIVEAEKEILIVLMDEGLGWLDSSWLFDARKKSTHQISKPACDRTHLDTQVMNARDEIALTSSIDIGEGGR